MKNAWWDNARLCDQYCFDLKLADYPRGLNRARINDLANGSPPYSEQEVEENGIEVNVNSLDLTTLSHNGRMQFAQGFIKPGRYFSATTDFGPKHKRTAYATEVTREMNRHMRKSIQYFETMRSKFAMLVLHGIAPCVWENRKNWCPRATGVEDALLPSGTLLGFENLPYIVFYRSFTGMELQKMAQGPRPDPGWNQPLVNGVLEWVDSQATTLLNTNWPQIWSPEKREERIKEQGGFYASDQCPTVDCFDIYAYVDDGKQSGWVRRIILDAWGEPSASGKSYTMSRKNRGDIDNFSNDSFLYTSRKRRVASQLSEIASFQFADLSAVAPFRYHSVRSLGFLMYAICHIQNRLRCKLTESMFEALMMYFRVKGDADFQRALKVDLVNRGFIDDTLQFVPAAERFQVNAQLVELGLQENQRIIQTNAASMSAKTDFTNDRTEKTKFQVMAELQAVTSLVSAGLQQAYQYQAFEYREIFRRFCIKNSPDADVQMFQANIARRGVPLDLLLPDLWDIEPERVMGGGNKTLEMAISQQLMQWRPLFDPSAQREVLRDSVMAITDDPARADMLVPEQPRVSDSVHDAQLASGSLLDGLPVTAKDGVNHDEYVHALLANMAIIVKRAMQTGSNPQEIAGLQNMGIHIAQHLQMMSEDDTAKPAVKRYEKQLKAIMGIVQRIAQALAKKSAQGNGHAPQVDPEVQAKIQGTLITAKAKAENTKTAHAQRTAQRQVQFEMEQKRKDVEAAQEQKRLDMETLAEIQRENLRTAQEVTHNERKRKSLEE